MSLPLDAAALPEVTDELNCPLCGYDLRGLPEHRCPECGHAFDPDELSRAKFEKREWFFEHATRHVLRAFVATALRTLRPLHFWTRVAASAEIAPRRLKRWTILWPVLYGLILIAAPVTATAGDYYRINSIVRVPPPGGVMIATSDGHSYIQTANGTMWYVPNAADLSVSAAFDRVMQRNYASLELPLLVAVLAWPAAVVLSMQLFGLTLRRAGIRRGHLGRCVVYPWPLVALPAVLVTAATFFADINQRDFTSSPAVVLDPLRIPPMVWQIGAVLGFVPVTLVALFVAIIVSTLHLTAAHVRYLRLPQAAMQALLVQAVAWLVILAGIYYAFGGA